MRKKAGIRAIPERKYCCIKADNLFGFLRSFKHEYPQNRRRNIYKNIFYGGRKNALLQEWIDDEEIVGNFVKDSQKVECDFQYANILIPANNEESYIAKLLDSLLQQRVKNWVPCIVVIANACTDSTVEICESKAADFQRLGWKYTVLETEQPGKCNAINLGERSCQPGPRIYLDADIVCSENLVSAICNALDTSAPLYATGKLSVMNPRSWISKQYRNFWLETPFIKSRAVGAGVYAVNDAGRARWGDFPEIISDDTFVRLNFSPSERVEVNEEFHWPLTEGFRRLVKVRNRQNMGVDEIGQLYPEIVSNEGKKNFSASNLLYLLFSKPVPFFVYSLVSAAVLLKKHENQWDRGR